MSRIFQLSSKEYQKYVLEPNNKNAVDENKYLVPFPLLVYFMFEPADSFFVTQCNKL